MNIANNTNQPTPEQRAIELITCDGIGKEAKRKIVNDLLSEIKRLKTLADTMSKELIGPNEIADESEYIKDAKEFRAYFIECCKERDQLKKDLAEIQAKLNSIEQFNNKLNENLALAENKINELTADSGSWVSGSKCIVCNGVGENDEGHICQSCAGTGDLWMLYKDQVTYLKNKFEQFESAELLKPAKYNQSMTNIHNIYRTKEYSRFEIDADYNVYLVKNKGIKSYYGQGTKSALSEQKDSKL